MSSVLRRKGPWMEEQPEGDCSHRVRRSRLIHRTRSIRHILLTSRHIPLTRSIRHILLTLRHIPLTRCILLKLRVLPNSHIPPSLHTHHSWSQRTADCLHSRTHRIPPVSAELDCMQEGQGGRRDSPDPSNLDIHHCHSSILPRSAAVADRVHHSQSRVHRKDDRLAPNVWVRPDSPFPGHLGGPSLYRSRSESVPQVGTHRE